MYFHAGLVQYLLRGGVNPSIVSLKLGAVVPRCYKGNFNAKIPYNAFKQIYKTGKFNWCICEIDGMLQPLGGGSKGF